MEQVYVDGSFCKRTKKYGAGVYKQRGLTEDAEQLFSGDCSSSSEAEYKAVLHGLQVAANSGFKHTSIMNDCESVMKKCAGLLDGEEPDSPVLEKIQGMFRNFTALRFVKVHRDDNRAHALSKIALENERRK